MSQVAFVKASNTGPADVFGISVALSTDGAVLAVGAYGEDSSANGVDGNQADNAASQSGAAYVFRSRNGLWAQEAYLKSSDTHPGADFGFSLALGDEGRALAVGAWGDTLDTGATSLFRRVGGAWAQDAYLESSNHQPGDVFGHSVSLSADAATLVCSALGEDSSARGIDGNQLDNSASDSGAVYLFTLQ